MFSLYQKIFFLLVPHLCHCVFLDVHHSFPPISSLLLHDDSHALIFFFTCTNHHRRRILHYHNVSPSLSSSSSPSPILVFILTYHFMDRSDFAIGSD